MGSERSSRPTTAAATSPAAGSLSSPRMRFSAPRRWRLSAAAACARCSAALAPAAPCMSVSSRAALPGARKDLTATAEKARPAGSAAGVSRSARSASPTDAAACLRTLGRPSTHRLLIAAKGLAQCSQFSRTACADGAARSVATSRPMQRTTPRSAGGDSCAARPADMSTLAVAGRRDSTGAGGACSSAVASTVSIAPVCSAGIDASARSREDIVAANTAVGEGAMPSCCRMSATASSTAQVAFDSGCRERQCRSHSSATGSPSANPGSASVDMTPNSPVDAAPLARKQRARCEDGALELHRRQKTAAARKPRPMVVSNPL